MKQGSEDHKNEVKSRPPPSVPPPEALHDLLNYTENLEAKIGLLARFLPFSPFCGGQKRASFLGYPLICLSPHLLNAHLRHTKQKPEWPLIQNEKQGRSLFYDYFVAPLSIKKDIVPSSTFLSLSKQKIPCRWRFSAELFLRIVYAKNMHKIFLYCGHPEYLR